MIESIFHFKFEMNSLYFNLIILFQILLLLLNITNCKKYFQWKSSNDIYYNNAIQIILLLRIILIIIQMNQNMSIIIIFLSHVIRIHYTILSSVVLVISLVFLIHVIMIHIQYEFIYIDRLVLVIHYISFYYSFYYK